MNIAVEPELEAFMKAQVRWGWGRWALLVQGMMCQGMVRRQDASRSGSCARVVAGGWQAGLVWLH